MDTIPESYVLMAEPDHLLIKPPPLLATADKAAAFPFHYIDHKAKENERIVQRFNEKNIPLTSFYPVGRFYLPILRWLRFLFNTGCLIFAILTSSCRGAVYSLVVAAVLVVLVLLLLW